MRDINPFLSQVKAWAANRPDILAIALVGSYARGAARADSDIDLVLICESAQPYLADESWLSTFGKPMRIETEDWGLVQSKRVFYDDGAEVEFGITAPEWTATDPVDEGTRQVIGDGVQIVSDPAGLLAALLRALADLDERKES
jgi:hypothetical protein